MSNSPNEHLESVVRERPELVVKLRHLQECIQVARNRPILRPRVLPQRVRVFIFRDAVQGGVAHVFPLAQLLAALEGPLQPGRVLGRGR